MLQMANNLFVDIRAVRILLAKALYSRTIIDRHMINNIHLRAKLQKQNLERQNNTIEEKNCFTKTSMVIIFKISQISCSDFLKDYIWNH